MNILDMLRSAGLTPRLASHAKGGEWHSGCPGCGDGDGGRGKDGQPSNRFHAWPEQEGGPICQQAGVPGTYWCRQCGAGGDMLQFLQDFEHLSFADACDFLGAKAPRKQPLPGRLPQPPKAMAPAAFTPRELALPTTAWRERAARLVERAHERLLHAPTPLGWLERRGLDLSAVRRYRLGYLEGEHEREGIIRPYSAWGMAPVEAANPDGTKSKRTTFFIPRGVTIPAFGPEGDGALPVRVRIRRSDADVSKWGDKYMVIKGGGSAPLLLGAERRAIVVVEAELDAMLVHHAAGDLCGALAVLTNLGKPDAHAHAALLRSAVILVALDYDKAGADGWAWWRATYPQAQRWPVPTGKDPGDAYALGLDLRAWVEAGLPAWLRSCTSAPAPAPAPAAPVGASPSGAELPRGEGAQPQPAAPPAVTPAQRRALARLAEFMARRHLSYGPDPSGAVGWQYPAELTTPERDELFDRLLPLVPADILAFIQAHPAVPVTAENLCAPLLRRSS